MKTLPLVLVALGFMGSARPGCGPFRPERERSETETKPLRPACNDAASQCYTSCFKREAGMRCGSCCFEQMILCDEQAQYSFQACEDLEPARSAAPEGGTNAAPEKAPKP